MDKFDIYNEEDTEFFLDDELENDSLEEGWDDLEDDISEVEISDDEI